MHWCINYSKCLHAPNVYYCLFEYTNMFYLYELYFNNERISFMFNFLRTSTIITTLVRQLGFVKYRIATPGFLGDNLSAGNRFARNNPIVFNKPSLFHTSARQCLRDKGRTTYCTSGGRGFYAHLCNRLLWQLRDFCPARLRGFVCERTRGKGRSVQNVWYGLRILSKLNCNEIDRQTSPRRQCIRKIFKESTVQNEFLRRDELNLCEKKMSSTSRSKIVNATINFSNRDRKLIRIRRIEFFFLCARRFLFMKRIVMVCFSVFEFLMYELCPTLFSITFWLKVFEDLSFFFLISKMLYN